MNLCSPTDEVIKKELRVECSQGSQQEHGSDCTTEYGKSKKNDRI